MKWKEMAKWGVMWVLALILAGCDKPEDKELALTPPTPPTPAATSKAERDAPEALALTGTVTYREREALPEDAVITLQLVLAQDVDNPAPGATDGEVIAEQQVPTAGRQVPIPFSFDYRGNAVDSGAGYGLRAEVRDGNGELLWSTLKLHPVSAGKPVELLLGKVNSPAEQVPAEEVLAE